MDLLPVRLRPFTEPDLELFDRLATDPALSEPFEWVGFTPPGGYRKALGTGRVARVKSLLSGRRHRR
jgi:hypothetical protein